MAVPPTPSDLGQDQHDHEEEVAENTDQEELDRGVNRHGVGSRASGGSPASMEARAPGFARTVAPVPVVAQSLLGGHKGRFEAALRAWAAPADRKVQRHPGTGQPALARRTDPLEIALRSGFVGLREEETKTVNVEPPREVACPAFGANHLPDHLDRPIGGLLTVSSRQVREAVQVDKPGGDRPAISQRASVFGAHLALPRRPATEARESVAGGPERAG